MRTILTLCAVTIIFLTACSPDEQSYTLYRNSVTDSNLRLHVAAFDATESEEYNRGNCEQAQLLFQSQPRIKTRFWCEKGRFKK